jgi:hypothetical protein
MYKRAFSHVHDTNKGDDTSFRYYVWQLGYGLFPWTGLAAGGLLLFQREGDEARSRKAETLALLVLWFVVAFGMFSVTKTKFHHYLLPGVPALGMLSGIVLDRALGGFELGKRRLAGYLIAIGTSSLLCIWGVARLFPGSVLGEADTVYQPWQLAQGLLALAAGLFLLVLGVWRFGRTETDLDQGASDGWLVAILGFVTATTALLVGRDLFSTVELSGSARLMHLFTYNYKRAWPSSLDFGVALKAFTLLTAAGFAALVVHRFQRHAALFVMGVALWWTAWGVDIYLFRVAPHWGQRETILEYYRRRAGPEEPFVAYQMNWKGENFYTGNRVPAFVQSGAKFKAFISEQKAKGVKVMFFTTEHTRTSSLKNELGAVKKFQSITTPELNNKFFLARVQF